MKPSLAARTVAEDVGSCPYCGYRPDMHTCITKAPEFHIEEGAVALCFKCGRVAVFTASPVMRKWMLRKPTEEEAEVYAKDRRLIRALKAWKYAKSRSPS